MLCVSRLLPSMLVVCALGCSGSDDSSTGAADTGASSDTTTGDVVDHFDSGGDTNPASDAPSDGGSDVSGDAAASPIGAPCTGPADCATLCLTASPFTGGYCTRQIAECPAPGGGSDPCPSGSNCANGVPFDGGVGDYCLKDCKTDGDCRTSEGYKCCAGLTHVGGPVCAPASMCH